MKHLIKKILKEENEWDWIENTPERVPLEDIESWTNTTMIEVSRWVKKIDEFYKKSPQVSWNDKSEFEDREKMIALSVKAIGDELRNIYGSLESILGEMDYLRNPEKFDEF